MKEHGICAKCKKSVGCPYADDRITGCKEFVLEPELQLINEEWLRQANTEQLAKFIVGVVRDGGDAFKRCNGSFEPLNIYKPEFWVGWLKQPHKPSS